MLETMKRNRRNVNVRLFNGIPNDRRSIFTLPARAILKN